MGFRLTDTVQVGGQPAVVTSISPNEITAIAPPAKSGVTGSVDVEVDDLPIYHAASVISGGISYDSGSGDALTLMSANEPMGTIPIGVPEPFTVIALGPNLSAAGGVSVIFTVASGTATLGCGRPTCTVTATGDGRATMNVTALDNTWSTVTVSLTNGSSLGAEFMGGTPPVLTSLSPMLSVAAGATVNWTAEALTLSNGLPLSGQSVAWQTGTGITAQSGAVAKNSAGIAANALTVGPLTEGQTVTSTACLNGTSQCVPYTAFGARPEYATLNAVSGTAQSLSVSGTPGQITLQSLIWTATLWPAPRSRSTRRSMPGRLPAPRMAAAPRPSFWPPKPPRLPPPSTEPSHLAQPRCLALPPTCWVWPSSATPAA